MKRWNFGAAMTSLVMWMFAVVPAHSEGLFSSSQDRQLFLHQYAVLADPMTDSLTAKQQAVLSIIKIVRPYAQQDDPEAAYFLAKMLGITSAPYGEEVRMWMERSAAGGYPPAIQATAEQGFIIESNPSMETKEVTALRLKRLEESANKCFFPAQLELTDEYGGAGSNRFSYNKERHFVWKYVSYLPGMIYQPRNNARFVATQGEIQERPQQFYLGDQNEGVQFAKTMQLAKETGQKVRAECDQVRHRFFSMQDAFVDATADFGK